MVSTSSSVQSGLSVDLLRECLSKAEQLKHLVETSRFPPPLATSYNGPIPDLSLPFPHDILLSIDNMGLSKAIRQQIKSKVTEKILQSQQACTDIFRRTCHELPDSLISYGFLSELGKSYAAFYSDHQLPKFRAKIQSAKAAIDTTNKKHAQHIEKPIFHSQFTPLLENYFEQNAYPSKPDRILLAKKSSMTERQIEVWFQNHRNRSKKEGVSLKRISPHQSSLPEILEQKPLPHACPSGKVPLSSRNDIGTFDNYDTLFKAVVNSTTESFPNPMAPPRTFPIPYHRSSQKNLVDSFPLQENTSRFPAPNWPRKPATHFPSSSAINMEEFIDMFASKLNIRRGSGMKSIRKTSKPWFHATVTIPSPAPHPALIRIKSTFQTSIPTSLLWNAASNPGTVSNASSSTPSSASNSFKRASKPRKTAPFAYRAPQKLLSLPTSDTSISTAQPSDSRTSSFASVSSFQSRSSSVLSTGSSPGPTTPPHSPTNDKHVVHESVIPELTSDKYIDDLFAGVPPDVPQNFDDFLNNINNEDLFSDKYLPTSTHNFPYLDTLYAAA